MEFWGVEVKANKSFKVSVKDYKHLRITQVALGVKNGEKVENVNVCIKTKDKKTDLILSSELHSQIKTAFVYEEEQDLVLSHGWKEGSVFFFGYFFLDHAVTPFYLDYGSYFEEETDFTSHGSPEKIEDERDLALEKYKREVETLTNEKAELEKKLKLLMDK